MKKRVFCNDTGAMNRWCNVHETDIGLLEEISRISQTGAKNIL